MSDLENGEGKLPPKLPCPPQWAHAILSSIADVQLGKTPGKTDYRDAGDHKIVKYRDLHDSGEVSWGNPGKGFVDVDRGNKLKLKRLRSGDVLISASAHSSEIIGRKVLHVREIPECFKAAFYVGEILCIRADYLCAPDLPRLLTYFFQSIAGYKTIQAKVHGVHLIASRAKEMVVPVPPKETQRRIVSKLDELFSRIDEGERALEQVSKLVERYRQSVLKAAVTGELTRDWRAARKARGEPVESGEALLARILTARRQAWEQAERAKMKAKGVKPANDNWKKKYKAPASPHSSDLPDLPDGWAWSSPVQIASSVDNALAIGPFGSNLKVADYEADGVPLIFVRSIRSQTFGGEGTKFVSQKKALELESHIARAGDVLITKMGDPPGDACVYPAGSPNAVITADCIKWTLHPLMPSANYVVAFINSMMGREQIGGITKGVAQQKVSLDRFRKIAVALAGPEEQVEISERIEMEFQKLESTKELIRIEMRRLVALRQSILEEAFSGRLLSQDPVDESAVALLKRIAAERTSSRTIASTRGRKKKPA